MAINRYRMYLGTLGNLRAFPGHPKDQPPSPLQGVSGVLHESMTGLRTLDRFGKTKRAWTLSWDMITEDAETYVQSILRGSAQAPVYMIDPRKRNLLPEDVSTGGSISMSSEAFTEVGAGAVAYLGGDVPTALVGIISGAQSWTGLTASQKLWGSAQSIPVVSGSTYRFSVYAKGSTNIQLAARPFDAAGVEGASALNAVSTVTGAWTRYDWNYTPGAGVVRFQFGLNSVASGTITTTGWMSQIDETLKAWTYGYGTPQVVPAPGNVQGGYWRTKYQALSLTMVEV